MPAVVESHPAQLPSQARRRLTREDCRALEAAGLLEWERYELIDGELIRKMPKSRPHTNALRLLCEWLRRVWGPGYVDQEAPIDLGQLLDATNEPEPDAIVLRRPAGEFRTTNPGPPDLLLVAEVSATTQDYDLGAKAALYASAGIAEYWVLDLRDMRIVVHRDPVDAGYRSIVAYAADEAVSPLAAASASIRLQDLTN
ncbi:MAG: Uma2 family endonuclease [Bryobacteraceae bacterium]